MRKGRETGCGRLADVLPVNAALYAYIFHLALLLVAWCDHRPALAGHLSGYLDYQYTQSDRKVSTPTGNTVNTESTIFSQRYYLALDQNLYPNFLVRAGGLFEVLDFDTRERNNVLQPGEIKGEGSASRIRPYVDFLLSTPQLTAGAGYNYQERTTRSSLAPSSTLIQENYTGLFRWNPDGLPEVTLNLSRKDTFDEERKSQDNEQDLLNANVFYRPVKPLELRYSAMFQDQKNRLSGTETETTTQDVRINYADLFWERRLSLSASYELNYRTAKATVNGQGEIQLPVPPLRGLYVRPPFPVGLDPARIELVDNPALIDGNLTTGADIELVFPSPPTGNATPREFGLDFFEKKDVNALNVFVSPTPTTVLPASIVSSLEWQVWISENNFDWSLLLTVRPASFFDPFENRFEVSFPTLSVRYIKLVVPPLPLSTTDLLGINSIVVTEIRGVLRKPASEVSRQDSQTSQTFDGQARVRLMDTPIVYYDLTYFYAKTNPNPSSYTVTNALTANHNFSTALNGTARVSREDGRDATGSRVAYQYGAVLNSIPLQTVTASFSFSGRDETINEKRSDTQSVTLSGNAELYSGANVNLSGGLNWSHQPSGRSTEGMFMGAGVQLVPHRTFTYTASYGGNTTTLKGGGVPEDKLYTRVLDMSAAFNPTTAIYLFGSYTISWVQNQDQPSRITNLNAGWSPFPGGKLRLTVSFVQIEQSADQSLERSLTPYVRWDINRYAYLEGSYSWITVTRPLADEENRTIFSRLRITF